MLIQIAVFLKNQRSYVFTHVIPLRIYPDSDSPNTIPNEEREEYVGSEESSIGEVSEETNPAGLEDINKGI